MTEIAKKPPEPSEAYDEGGFKPKPEEEEEDGPEEQSPKPPPKSSKPRYELIFTNSGFFGVFDSERESITLISRDEEDALAEIARREKEDAPPPKSKGGRPAGQQGRHYCPEERTQLKQNSEALNLAIPGGSRIKKEET